MQSGYHNLPTINNSDQNAGREHCAKDVSLSGVNGETVDSSCPASGIKFSLDIAGAYPVSAGVSSYRREFTFVPGSRLELKDAYSLKECTSPIIMNLLCYERPEISGGRAELGKVMMDFEADAFTAEIEEVNISDPRLRNAWQKDHLCRLRLAKKDRDLKGTILLRFTRKS
jgi:hypothetical protein